jgi:ATP-dependent protease Clp ATPase subunit
MSKLTGDGSLRCSFCQKAQKAVGKLISSPSEYPRAYICDECVSVCAVILEDDRAESKMPLVEPPHALLTHPLASSLMEAIERWIRDESLGKDGIIALREVRAIASKMVTDTDVVRHSK